MARPAKPKLSRGEAPTPPPGSELDRRLRACALELDYVYRSLRRQGVGPIDAEDLAQDVFLIAWRRRADFDQSRPLRPWLAGIAFKLAHQHRCRRPREVLAEEFDPEPIAELQPEALDARALVLRVLANLPERHRSVLVLHDIDGLSVHDIAALLDVPRFTLYTRLRRARSAFVKEANRLLEPTGRDRLPSVAAVLALERPPPRAPARMIPILGVSACLCLAIGVLGLLVARPSRPSRDSGLTLAAAQPIARVSGRRALRPARLQVPRTAAAPAPETDLARDLTGFWPFDDGPGSTVAADHSAGGRTCQLRDLDPVQAWIPGVRGGAIELGFNGWLECPQPEVPSRANPAVTVAVWVKRGGSPPLHRAVAVRSAGARGNYFFFGFGGDELSVSSTSWGGNLNVPFREPPGRWVHVAFTHETSHQLRLYVDGVEVAHRKTSTRKIAPVQDVLLVGAGLNGPGRSRVGQRFEGALDELRVYDRALSESELRFLASAQP